MPRYDPPSQMYKWKANTLIVVAHQPGREHLLDITLPNMKLNNANVQVHECLPGLGPVSAWRMADTSGHNYIIYTQSEILIPSDAVERMRSGHKDGHRSTACLYYINLPLMAHIDPGDPHAIQAHDDFGGVANRLGMHNHEMHEWKHHVCFTGHTPQGWEHLGFPPPRLNYGEGDDAWLWQREYDEGLPVNQVDMAVYHLFHGTDRIGNGGPGSWVTQNQDGRAARLRLMTSV